MSRRVPLWVLVCCLALSLPAAGIAIRDAGPTDDLLRIEDAFITDEGDGWTIGNKFIRYELGREGGAIALRRIHDPVGDRDWHRSNRPDSFVLVNGQRVDIGSSATPLLGSSVTEWWGGVRLDVRYRYPAASMEFTRSYACYPGSAVIETWTTYRATGPQAVTLSDLTNYSFAVKNGRLRWVSGLATPDAHGGSFTLTEDALDDGQLFELGSSARASEQVVPWFSVRDEDVEFFGAILWSGSWRLRLRRQSDDLSIQLGMPTFRTSVAAGSSLESPHAIFGLTNQLVPGTSAALRGFIDKGLRHGRRYGSYVSYNTWYSYGTFVEEGSLLAEMEVAASMGVEQFVVDAGWWHGIDPNDPGNFVHNWGTWQVDPERFPNGLGALSDRAHELGMRFGVWVEPERVARPTLNIPGLAAERLAAMRDGRYDPGTPNTSAKSAQICLANPAGRDWLLGKLMAFIEAARPDYLKWDNNFWINCNRQGHGHGTEDGNFQHTRGLQMVLERIRERFPDLEIENCASGGNRLSLDMLEYSDIAWLDDRTSPANHVRHNLEGLLGIFPASYLLTFVTTTEQEPVVDDPAFDLPFLMRSRMGGAFGLSWLNAEMGEGTRAMLAREIALYKIIRPILQEGSSFLLSRQQVQFPDAPWSGWDVIQHVHRTSGDSVVLAFDTLDAPSRVVVRLKGLRWDARYDVESADYGPIGSTSGLELMTRGIELEASSLSRGHVLILRAQPPPPELSRSRR